MTNENASLIEFEKILAVNAVEWSRGVVQMAKRFTDTGKWDKGSFMDLAPKMKLAWAYLCDKCDHAGIWDVNTKLMSMQIGWDYSLEDLLSGLRDRVELRNGSKLILKEFIEFQYGNLNPSNRVHNSILQRVKSLAPSKPLVSPVQGAMEMDMEMDMDSSEGGVRGEIISPAPIIFKNENMPIGDLRAQVEIAIVEWSKTLDRHKVKKDPWLDAPQIGQLIQAHKSVQKVALACLGAGYEAKGDGYDPSKNIGITRLFTPKIFDKFVNLGAQAQAEEAAKVERRAIVQKTHAEIAEHSPMDDLPPLSADEQGMFQKKFKQQIGKGA